MKKLIITAGRSLKAGGASANGLKEIKLRKQTAHNNLCVALFANIVVGSTDIFRHTVSDTGIQEFY